MEEEIKEAIGWLSALDPGSEYGATNKEIILSKLEQLEKENAELKEAKKSMREKLHSEHRARVYWERKAIQAKQVFEQKKTECKQLTKVLGEKNRKIKELEQDERIINKAIEYIERNARQCGNGEEWFESSYCCTSLLNILKENQKEV